MIMHTILSLDEVLLGSEKIKAPEMTWINGRMCQIDEAGSIVRLFSSDPLDYLNQNFSPGSPSDHKKG